MALRVIGRTNLELVEEWLASLSLAPISRVNYLRQMRKWFGYLSLRGYDADCPTTSMVAEYRSSMDGHSRYYINACVNRVRQFYQYCYEQGWWKVPVGAGVKSYKLHFRYNKLPLSTRQTEALMKRMANAKSLIEKRDAVMIYLMLFNGLRCVEVSRLLWSDIDQFDGYHIIHIQPKGHRQKDEMRRLPELTIAALEDYSSALLERYDNIQSLPVAVSLNPIYRGKPFGLRAAKIGLRVKMYLKEIGADSRKVTAHSLRHSYACMLLEHGVPIEEIQAQMGHANVQMTELYSAMVIDKKKIESDAINRIIAELQGKK